MTKAARAAIRNVRIFGAASGLGAADPGCAGGPDALRAGGLLEHLHCAGLEARWEETLRPAGPSDRTKAEDVAALCARLEEAVGRPLLAGDVPVVLGGDHSCAIGTWRGVGRAAGPFGLIWIDAHLDSHTPRTSPSGLLHGMPLAFLLGEGETPLAGPPALDPKQVCVVGVRSFEPEEAGLLQRLGVTVFSMEDIRRRGLEAVLEDALETVRRGTAGFGISIDLDALDPADAPGTGTPVPGGIRLHELLPALPHIGCGHRLLALEIAEFDPQRDVEGQTARAVGELAAAALAGLRTGVPQSILWEDQYAACIYEPLPVVLTRGQGAVVWDEKGRRYLDMMAAYSALNHGHCHPRLVAALAAQARRLAVTSRAFHNDRLPLLLKRLCEISGQDRAIPANTGLEAVEAALKTARRWAYRVKGVRPDAAEIICCENNFHGRSIAIVAMSSEPRYRAGFGPFPPGFVRIPFGDVEALEQAITPRTAAFLVEPIQGEGGINVPPQGYLSACAALCRRHNVLLICDEVQTGLGRTGRLFACDHDGVIPDGLILGKALGGGLLPVSAFLAREEVMGVLGPGDHGSTFGGNPLAAAVALEAIQVLFDERLVERSAELGAYFLGRLRGLASPAIREVRGKGLLMGVEIDPGRVSARELCERLMARGVLTKETRDTVLRFSPPLVITRDQLDEAFSAIEEVFHGIGRNARRAA
jgi:ornithine--oxo-acid transaminase